MPSLQKLLAIKSNDYTKLSNLFKKKTGVNIINGINKKIHLTKSCSVIIPFYRNCTFLKRNLISLWHQNLPSQFLKNKIEIIIINDGSPINLKKLIQQTRKFYPVIYLKLKKNYGRAIARNLGLLYAQNEILIFLDEDIVIPKDFLATHLLRHEFSNKCIIVGFRHNINLKDLFLRLNNLKQRIIRLPNYKNDFRYKKFIPSEWKNIYKDLPADNFNKTCCPLKESNYFKNFGKGKIFGVWELPFMFLTSNASISRREIIKVGGFDMHFKGWGLEDVHLAAKLITNGLYLIPNLHATVYHLIKKNSEKQKKEKIREYKRNLEFYNKLKNKKLNLFKEKQWKKQKEKYFKNKFSINYF